MGKSIFVSSVFEDSHLIDNLKNWEKKMLLGDITITSELQDKRHEGKSAIKNYIKKKIEGSSGVIVLVGKDTHNHDWIEVEVELANSFHKKIVCMRMPNTSGGVPQILSNFKLIAFDPNALKKALEISS